MSGADGWTRRQTMGAAIGAGAAALIAAPLRAGQAVPTQAGAFLGRVEDGVHVWRGIRYGHAGRFEAPRAVPRPAETIGAFEFGPVSPQSGGRYAPQAEDCLFLNIWSADPRPGASKPVMLYIHGGAYSGGSSTDPLNDGHALAARGDCVVVTVNHRLNAFGYLYLARDDARFTDSGNAGQLDLILALKWVRDNIAAFGGDPARVLVFGQSGGGAKIATMLGMPAARGLFQRAITMSGQQVTASGPLHAQARTAAYMKRIGAPTVDALLAMPTQRLVEALDATDPILGGGVYFGPVLDMRWLDRHPFWPDANPIGNAVPLILGNVHDEARAFIPIDGPKGTGLSWDNVAARLAPELRIDVLPEWVVGEYRRQYPAWSPFDVFYAAVTAGRSWRGQVIEAEERAKAGAPAWVYQVDFASRTNPRRGAFHTMDIPLAFGTIGASGSETGTGADARAASKALQDRFVRFAVTGDPDPAWPRYDLTRRATLIVDARSRVENDPRRWQRELFARIPYIQPGT